MVASFQFLLLVAASPDLVAVRRSHIFYGFCRLSYTLVAFVFVFTRVGFSFIRFGCVLRSFVFRLRFILPLFSPFTHA